MKAGLIMPQAGEIFKEIQGTRSLSTVLRRQIGRGISHKKVEMLLFYL
jgi:hypothetical protein